MRRFRYQVLNASFTEGRLGYSLAVQVPSKDDQYYRSPTELGLEGWELCSIVAPDVRNPTNFVAVFKQEIPASEAGA